METQLNRLKRLAAWDVEPALTDDDLNAALTKASTPDREGHAPDDAEWSPTFNLDAALAEAWLTKAARASALTEVDSSGIVTSRVFENCRVMAKYYRARGLATVRLR